MPDPRVLYVVTAVVVLALVVWVVVVLARPAGKPQASLGAMRVQPSNAPPARVEQGEPAEKASQPPKAEAAESLRRSRSRLDSHLEIQDQPEDESDEERKT
jgi:hypothetical protein